MRRKSIPISKSFRTRDSLDAYSLQPPESSPIALTENRRGMIRSKASYAGTSFPTYEGQAPKVASQTSPILIKPAVKGSTTSLEARPRKVFGSQSFRGSFSLNDDELITIKDIRREKRLLKSLKIENEKAKEEVAVPEWADYKPISGPRAQYKKEQYYKKPILIPNSDPDYEIK